MSYEELRQECIDFYNSVYNDELAFDANKVDKATRAKLLNDEVYLKETKAISARLFRSQVNKLKSLSEDTGIEDRQASVRLKALDMLNAMIFKNLDAAPDEREALNVKYAPMTEEELRVLPTVEVNG